jgi:predicted nucleic acid-binding protein
MKAVNDEIAVNALTTNLGKGESEVIILCKESGFDYALIDERTAREKAALASVNTMGVLGFMDLAIEMGFAIDKKRLVKQLREVGFRISDKLYKRMFPDN